MALSPEDLQQIVEALGPVITAKAEETLSKSASGFETRLTAKILKSTQAPKVEEVPEEEPTTLKGQMAVLQKQLADIKVERDRATKQAMKQELKSSMASMFGQDNPHLDVYAEKYMGRLSTIEDQTTIKVNIDGEDLNVSLADGLKHLAQNELKSLVPQKVQKLPTKVGARVQPGTKAMTEQPLDQKAKGRQFLAALGQQIDTEVQGSASSAFGIDDDE